MGGRGTAAPDDAGDAWFDDAGTPFPDSTCGPDQEAWLTLLRTGQLPPRRRRTPVVLRRGRRLGATPRRGEAQLAHRVPPRRPGPRRGDLRQPPPATRPRWATVENAWALRGLAEVAGSAGRRGEAADLAVGRPGTAPAEWRLVAEAIERLLDDDRPRDALAFVDARPDDGRRRGRLRLLEGFAADAAGDVERAAAILAGGLEVADLREGERSIDRLWAVGVPRAPLARRVRLPHGLAQGDERSPQPSEDGVVDVDAAIA